MVSVEFVNARLTAAEAAAHLGVSVRTLYAYVSRGVLHSQRAPDQRRSLFDAAEVERFAKRPGRRTQSPPPAPAPELTRIEGTSLSYRGQDACDLALARSFESVAEWLWTATWSEDREWTAHAHVLEAARQSQMVLPEDAPDFEESIVRACRLVQAGDPRIGKTPKPRRRPQARSEQKPATAARRRPKTVTRVLRTKGGKG